MIKETKEEKIEESLLSPFECSNCHSIKCVVRPILPKYTEDHQVGLAVNCGDCGLSIGVLTVSEDCGRMLLDVEREIIQEKLNET